MLVWLLIGFIVCVWCCGVGCFAVGYVVVRLLVLLLGCGVGVNMVLVVVV